MPTLETRNSDELDFYTLSVWQIRVALERALAAGRADFFELNPTAGAGNAAPSRPRFKVKIIQTMIHVGWVAADTEDDAIDLARDLFDSHPSGFRQTAHEIDEVMILDSEEVQP
jgi:hypothetical protein